MASAPHIAPAQPVVGCSMVFDDHEQCPRDWSHSDPGLEAATAGSFAGSLVRMLAGFDPSARTWSRTRCSYQINRWLELGWAHFSAGKSEKFLGELVRLYPQLAREAFGASGAQWLSDPKNLDFLREHFRGETRHDPAFEWLAAGWASICRRAEVQALYSDIFWRDIVSDAVKLMQSTGARDKRTFALAVRLRTSGKLDLLASPLRAGLSEAAAREQAIAAYKKPDRTAMLAWSDFDGTLDRYPLATDLRWTSEPGLFSSSSPTTRVVASAAFAAALAGVARYYFTRVR